MAHLCKYPIRISIRLINLINCYYYWHTCCFSVVNSLFCLWHNSIISSYYYNNNISNTSSSSPHLSKCCMTRSINKGNRLIIIYNLICSYMLCNSSSFSCYYISLSNRIKKCCFTMVNMSHNSNYWRSFY